MKRIHFGNLKRKSRWLLLAIGLVGLSLVVNGAFEIIEFENPKINKYLNVVGYLIVFGISSQMFWYQNYVQWTKRGILIKIRSFFGINIKFKDIKTTELTDKKIIITETYGNKHRIDVSHIVESDGLKLYEIILENTNTNFEYGK